MNVGKTWTLYQMNRMRPFYLVPTPYTDSKPKLGKLRKSLYCQKPSFQSTYYLVNGKIICKDKMRTMEWYIIANKLYWFSDKGCHIWEYGKDFTIRIKPFKRLCITAL